MKSRTTCDDLAQLTPVADEIYLICPACGWNQRLEPCSTLSDVVVAETIHISSEKRAEPGA